MADCSQSRYVSTTRFLVADPQTIARFVVTKVRSNANTEIPTEEIPAIKSLDDIERNIFLFKNIVLRYLGMLLGMLYLTVKSILFEV